MLYLSEYEGLCDRELATYFGVVKQTIAAQRRKHGIFQRPHGHKKLAISDRQVRNNIEEFKKNYVDEKGEKMCKGHNYQFYKDKEDEKENKRTIKKG